MSVSISDAAPANTSIMSLTLPVTGVALTPSGGGNAVSIFSSSTKFELTRLQADSGLVAANVSVAAGSYSAVKVTVAAPSGVYFNGSGAAIGSCANGAACAISGSAASITFTFSSPLVLTANQAQWLDLDFNYSKAIVSTSTSVSIDVTQANVLSVLTTPPTGVPSGDFASIDDFTGQVTAVSNSSITIKSTVRGTITATINSSTIPVNDPQSQCTASTTFSCVKVGSIVSLQGALTNAGIITGTSLDLIDVSTTPADEVEGTLYANTACASGLGMILSDSSISTSSPLASASFGQNVCLTLATGASFVVDKGILTGQVMPQTGFAGTGDLLAGQTVRAKVSSAVSGTNVINATVSALILRFSRLTATVSITGNPTFSITSLPVYFGTLATQNTIVATYVNATQFEGVSGAASVTTGPVSITALFLNPASAQPPFQAAKVRVP